MPDYRAFTWEKCRIHRDAADIGAWPITSEPTGVLATNGEVIFEHTKSGQWPVVPYEDIVVEGVIWTLAPEGDGWRAATWDRLRPGQTDKEMTGVEYQKSYALNLPGWIPRSDEIVGYFVSTPARMDERGPRNERSRIAWVKYGTDEIVALEHMGGLPLPTPDPPPVEPPSSDLAALEARVAALELYAVRQKAWAWAYPDLKGR